MEKKKKKIKKKNKLKILGVCGGNGVFLHPLKKYLVSNIEPRPIFHTKSQLQWYLNFKVPLFTDMIAASYVYPKIDIIIGAPDCGHSSILNLSKGSKAKNPLENASVKLFFESVKFYKPKLFVMENLPALLNKITMADFKSNFPNYMFVFHTLSVAEFGNSQKTRKRLIVIGFRKDLKRAGDVFMHMNDIYPVAELKKVGELLEGIGEDDIKFGNVREDEGKLVKMGAADKETLKSIAKVWRTDLKGETYWPMTNEKYPNIPYIPGVYRLHKKEYPQTVKKDTRQFRPDGKPLSPRELARIQGIPDSFKLYIDPDKKDYSINKARATVAKGVPYEVGLWLSKQLEKCLEYL
jgi:site-specific DNA-cytosine methylase